MKLLSKYIFSMIFMFSIEAYAFECLDYSKRDTPLVDHVSLASQIFWGTIISGDYNAARGNTTFKVKVDGVLKGKIESTMSLLAPISGNEGGVTLGHNKIFFLYGSNEVNSCSMEIELLHRIDSLSHLAEYAKGYDVVGAHYIRQILDLTK